MGYRYYIYEIENHFLNEIRQCKTWEDFVEVVKKNKPKAVEDLLDECDYIGLYRLGHELHEFGKYYENADEMYKHGESLFFSDELNERYEDYGAIVLEPDGIKCAIDWTKNKVISYYKDLLNDNPDKNDVFVDSRPQLDRLKDHAQDELRWWSYEHCPCDSDMNTPFSVNSWLYEHVYFDLVHIYKTFDWKNKSIIFMGW